MSKSRLKTTVKVDRLFLATDNPRHDEVDDEMEAIERLCSSENIEELARDILTHGTSPAERLIVFPSDENTKVDDLSDSTPFVVAEGNRRVCALKLLHDPELAPAKLRASIKNMLKGKEVPDDIDVVVMLDSEERRHWMRRIHDGVQGGKGRKPWNAEQKTRFSGTKRNVVAQQLFDFAVRHSLMKEGERQGNFSHMARLVGNVVVAETLGIDTSNGVDELQRTRPFSEFILILTTVLEEAKNKKLGSQARKAQIDRFGRGLNSIDGVTSTRISPEPLDPASDEDEENDETAVDNEKKDAENHGGDSERQKDGDSDSSKGSSSPKSKKYIRGDAEVTELLEELQHDKLISLYSSLTTINCSAHTPLIAVGVWSFVETLAASVGCPEEKPFKDFFSRGRKGRLAELGLGHGKEVNDIVMAIDHVSRYGNTTKHSSTAAYYEYRQVINDMSTLKPLIIACLKALKANG